MRISVIISLILCLLLSALTAASAEYNYYEVFSVGEDNLSFEGGANGEPIRFGVRDYRGNEVIPPVYEEISLSDDLRYCVVRENGLAGYMDMKGEWFIEPQYDLASCFTGDYAVVAHKGYDPSKDFSMSGDGTYYRYGIIDRENRTVLPQEYEYVQIHSDGTAEADGVCYLLEGAACREIATLRSDIYTEDYEPFNGVKLPTPQMQPECDIRPDGESRYPRLDGIQELLPLYAAAVQAVYPETTRYESNYAKDPVITCSGLTTALERLHSGAADMIFMTEDEAKAADDGSVEYTPFARDAFVFTVNAENPIEDMTAEQLRNIFTGKIGEWSELGAADLGEIVIYEAGTDSQGQNTLVDFLDGVMPVKPVQEERNDFFESRQDWNVEYRNRPDAIGCAYHFFCGDALEKGIKLLSVDGVAPTEENVKSGAYQPATDYCLVIRADEKNANVLALRDWLLSPQGQALVEKAGFTALK